MPEDMDEVPDKIVLDPGDLKKNCGLCGFAIYRMEIKAEMYGNYVEFDTRNRGSIDVFFCGECWDIISKNIDAPPREGIAKRRVLQSLDNEDNKAINDANYIPPLDENVIERAIKQVKNEEHC